MIATITVGIILAAIVAGIIASMIRNKRKALASGNPCASCGCGCSSGSCCGGSAPDTVQ